MRDVRAGRVERVVCFKLDRLGRSLTHLAVMKTPVLLPQESAAGKLLFRKNGGGWRRVAARGGPWQSFPSTAALRAETPCYPFSYAQPAIHCSPSKSFS